MSYSLLLLSDVDSLGRKGQVVKTKRGYARNFLLPKKMAVVADAHTLRMQERLSAEREKQALVDKSDSEALAAKMAEVNLVISVKVDHEGHMYGSVAAPQIVAALLEQAAIELDKKAVTLKHPIKKTGVHDVTIRLKEGVLATLSVSVEAIESEGKAVEAK
jgi:large subunit ribosomal protein L9